MAKRIYIVGIGPGKISGMTLEAYEALKASDVIVGYTVYVDLVKEEFKDKEFMVTAMTKEIERCRLCIDLACEGKTVAMICSGDAGVYGMASPLYEELGEDSDIELVVVPGVTAANSGAAVLGAPLNHDFCVISLSDLLTPWETIEKRLKAAIEGDFAIAIYNPSSRKRHDYLKNACEIMLTSGAREDRACGYVKNIGRDNTETYVCSLGELKNREVDMFTTVFVGNSMSYIKDGKLITKRGYK